MALCSLVRCVFRYSPGPAFAFAVDLAVPHRGGTAWNDFVVYNSWLAAFTFDCPAKLAEPRDQQFHAALTLGVGLPKWAAILKWPIDVHGWTDFPVLIMASDRGLADLCKALAQVRDAEGDFVRLGQ